MYTNTLNDKFQMNGSSEINESIHLNGSSQIHSGLNNLIMKPTNGVPKNKYGLDKIHLDGLVILKMMKHCNESQPGFCIGSLLGMEVNNELEITNCFPLPDGSQSFLCHNDNGYVSRHDKDNFKINSKEENLSAESLEYQNEMLKKLQDVNIDCNLVGIYRSTCLNSFCTSELIKSFYFLQDKYDHDHIQRAVFLIYDPYQTEQGNFTLKAYRLTDTFMKMYREYKKLDGDRSVVRLSKNVIDSFGDIKLCDDPDNNINENESIKIKKQTTSDVNVMPIYNEGCFTTEQLFDEVPIEINNPHLYSLLLDDLRQSMKNEPDIDSYCLNLSNKQFLSNNLEFLLEEADNLSNELSIQQKEEQDQIQFIYHRQNENKVREENGLPPLPLIDPSLPIFKNRFLSSKFESMLIKKQISIYAQQINNSAGATCSKLYLAKVFQEK